MTAVSGLAMRNRRRIAALASFTVLLAALAACNMACSQQKGTVPLPRLQTVRAWRAPSRPTRAQPFRPPLTRPVGTYGVAVSQFTATDSSRPTPPRGSVPGHAGRTLTTTIYRPTTPGPWPLVMYAHGFNVDVASNAPLLQALASAGFVVAAPRFPGSAPGFPGPATQSDMGNQAIDLGFLVSWLQAHGSGGIDFSAIGAIGHSDGGTSVAALALNDRYQDHRFRAFAVLAGERSPLVAGSWGPRNTAALLSMTGTNDEYGLFPAGRGIYDTAASPRAWIPISGATHFSAYFGSGAQADATRATLADFFSLHLRPVGADINRFLADAQREGLSLTLPFSDPLLQRWDVFGGTHSPLGQLATWPAPAPGGSRHIELANGDITESPSGVHEVQGTIWQRWRALGGHGGFIGLPTSDETATSDGVGRFNGFTGGAIFWSPVTGAHELHGTLGQAWILRGAERGALGYPTTDQAAVGDNRGVTQQFERGSLWSTDATKAHAVLAPFENAWFATGGPRGALGYPVSDAWGAAGVFITSFEHGAVYVTVRGGFALSGPIYQRYVAIGSVSSRLGPPTSSIKPYAGGAYASFAHGYITWDPRNGAVTVATGPDHRPR
ncbi:MAG: repeat protein [Acidimicrobiales bacterium]|nr:repeat protein [Acidimicrobiales bacterium]